MGYGYGKQIKIITILPIQSGFYASEYSKLNRIN